MSTVKGPDIQSSTVKPKKKLSANRQSYLPLRSSFEENGGLISRGSPGIKAAGGGGWQWKNDYQLRGEC